MPTLTIADGDTGRLTLHLTSQELRALVAACRRVVQGPLPPGASMILVHAREQVYAVHTRSRVNGGHALRIANLYHPRQEVLAPYAQEETALTLIQQLARLHHTSTGEKSVQPAIPPMGHEIGSGDSRSSAEYVPWQAHGGTCRGRSY